MMSSLDKDVGDDAPALDLFVEYHTEYTPILLLSPLDEQIYRRVWPLSAGYKQFSSKVVLSIFHVLTHRPQTPPILDHFGEAIMQLPRGSCLGYSSCPRSDPFSFPTCISRAICRALGGSRARCTLDRRIMVMGIWGLAPSFWMGWRTWAEQRLAP